MIYNFHNNLNCVLSYSCHSNVFFLNKTESELRSELENLALRLFYMENAKEDVRSDISVMRRAAEKVESEVSKAEMEKQKQASASILDTKSCEYNHLDIYNALIWGFF